MSDAMSWAGSFGERFADVAWKATALLALAWIIDRMWLRRRLLAADVLWTAAMLGLIALPMATATLPAVVLPIWRVERPPIDLASGRSRTSEDIALVETEQEVSGATSGAAGPSSATTPHVATIERGEAQRSSWPDPWTAAIVCCLLLIVAPLTSLVHSFN